jgi:GTP-binding protein HflX
MAVFLPTLPKAQRAFLVGVQTPEMPEGEGEELLAELTELVENLGLSIVRATLIKLRSPSPALYIGKGKAEELVAVAKSDAADVIVFDSALSPAQQRNWEELAGFAVIDRQEVILEVFADRAHTREAVLQVALARMEYSLPRLTRAWTHLSRQRGKGAMGGEGETQLEQDRRVVRNRIAHLKEELAAVVRQRGVQRTRRVRVPLPTASSSPATRSSCSPTRWDSSGGCRTGSWRRSRRPLRRCCSPTSSSMWWMSPAPTSRSTGRRPSACWPSWGRATGPS